MMLPLIRVREPPHLSPDLRPIARLGCDQGEERTKPLTRRAPGAEMGHN